MNLLGVREPELYGNRTYESLLDMIREEAERLGVEVAEVAWPSVKQTPPRAKRSMLGVWMVVCP